MTGSEPAAAKGRWQGGKGPKNGRSGLRVSFAGALLFLLLCNPACLASGFKVSGTMTSFRYTNSTYIVRDNWEFEAIAIDNQWKVSVQLQNGQRLTDGSDGHSDYFLLDDPRFRGMPAGGVFKGNYPVQGAIHTTLPWLAYCSQAFFKTAVTNGFAAIPAPWLIAYAMPLAHIYTAQFEGIEGCPYLPKRVAYVPSAERIAALRDGSYGTVVTPNDSNRDSDLIQLARYDGLTQPEAVYEVTLVTNYQGIPLPWKFVYEKSLLKKQQGKTVLSPSSKIEGVLVSVETVDAIDVLPRVEGKAKDISIADYRFHDEKRGVAFLSYRRTNSTWIANESDPYLQRLLSSALRSSSRRAKSPKFSQMVVLVTLVFIISLPLAFGAVRSRVFTVLTGFTQSRPKQTNVYAAGDRGKQR